MKITIYSTKTCGYCHMLKNWLDDKKLNTPITVLIKTLLPLNTWSSSAARWVYHLALSRKMMEQVKTF